MTRYTGRAVVRVLACLVAMLPAVPSSAQIPAAPAVVKVFVQTDDTGDPSELSARRESVKDLTSTLAAKRKTTAIVDTEDHADIVVDVLSRGLIVPKVVIGLGARPGQPASANPVRAAVLRVRLTLDDNAVVFTNKNKPSESPRGWKSAADDIGHQIEEWIQRRRESADGKIPDRPVQR